MRPFTFAIALAMGIIATSTVGGTELDDQAFAGSVDGSYLLFQEDGFQRVVTLSESGTVAQVSEQEPLYGYSSGLGAWTRTEDKEVRIRIIDFEYDLDEGTTTGVARLDIVLTFSKLEAGKYQAVEGSYKVEAFDARENPLAPRTQPNRTTGASFTGVRIAAPTQP